MQPMSPAATPKPKGTAGLWIGAALILLGIIGGVIAAVVSVQSVSSTVDGYQRVPADGGGSITVDEPGIYRLFLERPGVDADGVLVSPPAIEITAPDGARVSLTGDSTSESYSFDGRDGRKLGRFQAAQPGEYRITTSTSLGGEARGNLAVGRKGPSAGFIGLGLAVLGGIALVVLGIIVMIISGVRRSRSRRTPVPLLPGPGVGGWGAPPPPGPATPAGWSPPPPQGAPGWAPPPPPPGGSPSGPPPGSSGPVS